ncbi:hypothetical protein [Jannaschia donghaensis]|uniref:SnoaL-like domain-containing protein n=1 Tax=Jannaschia donghaensis TaxID=420998 RepID=A0A0M6YMD5_9RHOB|nr:hypothetical protein [Jannaschia donghaensis]CTQ50427.1 hypothetical protein JDO7802_02451 [Jannaschia donghaensis]
MSTALEIYQDHLDQVSHLIWIRDFEAVTRLMTYPHELLVDEEVTTVDSPATLIEWATKFRDRLQEMGATGYHRVAIAAAFTGDDEDRIDGFHRVYVLDGASHLIEPYSSEASLLKHHDVWLGRGVRATLRKARYAVDDEA